MKPSQKSSRVGIGLGQSGGTEARLAGVRFLKWILEDIIFVFGYVIFGFLRGL